MSTPLADVLARCGITQSDVALALGVDNSTISHKLAGRRRWSQPEVTVLLALIRRKDPMVGYDDLFAASEVEAEALVTDPVEA
jgi:transcriptional regulator with XRE-family HTH domain